MDPLTAWRKRRLEDAEYKPSPGFMEPAPSAEQKRRDEYAIRRAQGDSPRRAALGAGYPEKKANVARRDLEPKALATIAEVLPMAGADNERLAGVIADALDATKRARDGVSMDPDHTVRLSAVRTAAELTGQLKRDAGSVSSVSITLAGPLAEAFMAARAGMVIDGE